MAKPSNSPGPGEVASQKQVNAHPAAGNAARGEGLQSSDPPITRSPDTPKSCRNCAHARLHLITFPDVPEFEQEVRLCAAGSPCWTSVVNPESFFTNPKKWIERAAQCPAYHRKLGAR